MTALASASGLALFRRVGPATIPTSEPPPVRRREIIGWCSYDFANSAFTTIIITVVFAPWFMSVIAAGNPLGPGWWGTALAVSQVVIILVSPLIGAIADVTARKKVFLMIAAVVCSVATVLLALAGAGDIWLALGLVVTANIAFSLGENLCASFLPEISTPQTVGRISGYGWSFGYLGGLLSLVLALAIINSGPGRVPWTFVMTGGFFLLACLPTLMLRERAQRRTLAPGESWIGLGLRQLAVMRRELPRHRTLLFFFVALFFYIAGLTAIVAFASVFATEVLAMTQAEIIKLFIVLQLAGVAGAWGFGLLQDRTGPRLALVISLLQWIVVCGWAAVCTTKTEFFLIGMLAGSAMGSLQAGGRAVVALLTPPGRGGEFFGYWGFFTKLAGVVGQPVFGWLAAWHGYRVATLVNCGFFIIGLIVLLGLRLRPSAR
ncbi:MAG: MFS transporter [Opitutaceae bacterium]|nr:MFS transporter [Opitutaceae bacterium]